jgi:C4-dicarboxylate-specific signal transduction histidine kinase
MWAGLSESLRGTGQHWAWMGLVVCLLGLVLLLWRRTRLQEGERRRIEKAREELEAYAQLDARVSADGDMSDLAKKVSRLIVEKSAFHRAAMVVRDGEGRLYVAGSVGMDEQTIAALGTWGDEVVTAERSGRIGARRGDGGSGMRVGRKSFAVVLGKGAAGVGCGRAIVMPMWTTSGRMVGALAVCADGLLSVRRSAVTEAIVALEALAVKLGRSLENAALAERLLRAEKLAGLGLMAGGVAHALNNPLTAVMGFAELIAHTTSEPRVQEDAETIVHEAKRMRETVASLANYWQPMAQAVEPVEMQDLLRELTGACAEKLRTRGVQLVLQTDEALPTVRGNRERLRQVMEHLLNNAAQAVGAALEMGVAFPLNEEVGEHTIRIAVSHDERMLNLIVSDTGPGFREPARVFDPFYVATVKPGEGAGIGLSICYGIVREHGGEISAFNLHPHGAAVMVELPVERDAVAHFAAETREVA